MRQRRALLAVMVAASVAASGCSPAGEAAPPTGSGSPAPRPTVAPSVTRTLDLAAYRTRPCDVLTPEQQAAFDRPGLAHRELIAYCTWNKQQTRSGLDVVLGIGADRFNQLFQESGEKHWRIFESRPVAGQPAVVVSDSPDPSRCEVVVGAGPKDSITVRRESGTNHEDSCRKAVDFAEQVVRNLAG